MRARHSLVVAAALLAACSAAETPEQTASRMAAEAAAARTAITARQAEWSRHLAAGHADSVAMMYHPNVRVMGMNEAVMHGREAVAAAFGGMMQAGTWHITLSTDSVWANGPLIVTAGSWTLHLARAPNPPPDMPAMDTTGSGSFMERWVKEGNDYFLMDDIYNSNQPLPPPPPRRR